MKALTIRQMVLSAVMLSLCLVLPFLTMQFQVLGTAFTPMHYPVLLCGFLCGPVAGFVVGLIAPLLRSLLFQMPPMYPTAMAMMIELATYGLIAGFLYQKYQQRKSSIYVSLISAMVIGRIFWGITMMILLSVKGSSFTFATFISQAVLGALPGIILQLVLVPCIILAVNCQYTKSMKVHVK